MLTEYIRAAMERAEYEKLEDGTYYGEIPGLQGVYADGPRLESCRTELQSALEDWLLVGLRLGHQIPVLDGIDLNAVSVESPRRTAPPRDELPGGRAGPVHPGPKKSQAARNLSRSDALQRLDEFRQLRRNWDSYDADPISTFAIQRAQELVQALERAAEARNDSRFLPFNIAPVADGGIQFEWQGGRADLEIEISAEGNLSFSKIETNGAERRFSEGLAGPDAG